MDITNFHVEALSSSHLEDVTRLFSKTFNKRVSSNYFALKYPVSVLNMPQAYVLLNHEKVIGFIGSELQEYRVNTKSYHFLDLREYFIDAAYRSKGLFKILYQHVLNEAQKNNLDCLISFDSEQTSAFHLKQGWQRGPLVNRFEIKGSPKLTDRIVQFINGNQQQLNRLREQLKDYRFEDDLLHVLNSPDTTKVYSEEWLHFKKNKPHFIVSILGYVSWIKIDHHCTIENIQSGQAEDFDQMIDILTIALKKARIRAANFHCMKGSETYTLLQKKFMPEKSYDFNFLQLNPDLPEIDLFRFQFINSDQF